MRQAIYTALSVAATISACAAYASQDTMERAVDGDVVVTDGGLTAMTVVAAQRRSIGQHRPGPWVVVEMQVQASNYEPELFDPMFQELIIDSVAFDPDPAAAESLNAKTVSSASLQPGTTAAVSLAFKISVADANELRDGKVYLIFRGYLDSVGIPIALKIR